MHPKLIFIIGTACSGKSSFIRAINVNDYVCIDDAKHLYKFFCADELLRQNHAIFSDFIAKNGLQTYYIENKPNSIAVPGGGYRITNPAVWDYILQMAAQEIQFGNKYIIEFARGIDSAYTKAFHITPDQIYPRAISNILNNVPQEFKNHSLIINIYADFTTRHLRNYQRRENGGHFVNENSMKTIYKSEIFSFEHLDMNTGFFSTTSLKIPVYSFENANCSDETVMLNKFVKHYQKALDFYTEVQHAR